MMKSKNHVNLFGNGASLFWCTFLAGCFGKGNLFYYHPKGPLISLQKLLTETPNAIHAVNLQPVYLTKKRIQPVWVK